MSDTDIIGLMRQAPFSFVGTVEHLGAATMSNLPINARTAVVQVTYVLHSPPAFTGMEGQRITVQLADGVDLPAVGDSAAFFAQGLAFGESIAVSEVSRLPVEAVMGHITDAATAGRPGAFDALKSQMDAQDLKAHSDDADAVVIGSVSKLERAFGIPSTEHDPDWWKATINVTHVEKGDVALGDLEVLYPNSSDVRWKNAPKPKASQGGVWLLHTTAAELHATAPFTLLHAEDVQPIQGLDTIRGNGG